jgi:hypothetical protein
VGSGSSARNFVASRSMPPTQVRVRLPHLCSSLSIDQTCLAHACNRAHRSRWIAFVADPGRHPGDCWRPAGRGVLAERALSGSVPPTM